MSVDIDYLGEPIMLAKHSQIFQCDLISVKYEEGISWLVTYKCKHKGFKIGCSLSILSCQWTGETRIRRILIV